VKVPIRILPMFHAGRFSHKMKLFFFFLFGSSGFFGFILWEVPMLWGEIMGVTLVLLDCKLKVAVKSKSI
jgi:hypothetical protein